MWTIGNFAFAAPWALGACLILPFLWHLLKIIPPKPISVRFPAVRILHELSTSQVITAKTPWWVLLMRLLIITFLIAAMAKPLWNVTENAIDTDAPLIIVIDNDWSVMDRWADRKSELNKVLDRADRMEQSVLLVPTATPLKTWPLQLETASEAKIRSATLRPEPWLSDRNTAFIALKEKMSGFTETPSIVWISNGMMESTDDDFISSLHQFSDLNLFRDDMDRLPSVISAMKRTAEGFKVTIVHTPSKDRKNISLTLQDDQAHSLYQQKVSLEPDTQSTETLLELPLELRHRADRLRIDGFINPGSQFLLDEKWQDHPAGLIKQVKQNKSLLDPSYYIRKSLRPYTVLREESLDALLSRDLSILFDVGHHSFSAEENKNVLDWVSKGGLFVRFASLQLTQDHQHKDPLLPVTLLDGERAFGGTLSWKRSTNLAPFPENSPFVGLATPKDIRIHRQVLARPEGDLAQKTWANLEDGTPLITALAHGEGWTILFHITGAPDWSNLPLSGTFELMMMRLLSLSSGSQNDSLNQSFPPYLIFNAQGELVPANGSAVAIEAKRLHETAPSALYPAGLYGQKNIPHALNLGPFITEILPITDIPLGVIEQGFDEIEEIDLTPWALLFALSLALLDWTTSLSLRGFMKASSVLLGLLIISPVSAKDTPETLQKKLASANDMRLAYVLSHDAQTDDISKRGLEGLGMMLKRRTAVELAQPMAFDPETDDPTLFPMIYWPIEEKQEQLSDAAAEKLNRFLKTGGFILFDTQGKPRPRQLANLSEKLDMPRLRTISSEHVLTRSFYLMQHFPGRFDQGDIWVESNEDNARDNVSSVLVGSNAWAQAWARDDAQRPIFAVVPGGEVQREQAFRFGINLVMYILTGNYKGDQVHLPAILQRLGL